MDLKVEGCGFESRGGRTFANFRLVVCPLVFWTDLGPLPASFQQTSRARDESSHGDGRGSCQLGLPSLADLRANAILDSDIAAYVFFGLLLPNRYPAR